MAPRQRRSPGDRKDKAGPQGRFLKLRPCPPSVGHEPLPGTPRAPGTGASQSPAAVTVYFSNVPFRGSQHVHQLPQVSTFQCACCSMALSQSGDEARSILFSNKVRIYCFLLGLWVFFLSPTPGRGREARQLVYFHTSDSQADISAQGCCRLAALCPQSFGETASPSADGPLSAPPPYSHTCEGALHGGTCSCQRVFNLLWDHFSWNC